MCSAANQLEIPLARKPVDQENNVRFHYVDGSTYEAEWKGIGKRLFTYRTSVFMQTKRFDVHNTLQ